MTNQDNIGTYIPMLEEIEGKKKKRAFKICTQNIGSD